MIRMTLALLACIAVTMSIAGRDPDGVAHGDRVADVGRASSAPAELANSGRLSLDDEAGAIERALAASASVVAPTPALAVTEAASDTAADESGAMRHLHAITGNRVNLRRGPSTADTVVDQVVRDQRVEVLEEAPGGWLRIRVVDTGTEAFIYGSFVEPAAG